MGPFEMVVLIVLISVGAGVMNNYVKAKANRSGDAETEADMAQVRADVARLKERVHVLEKIVTDKDRQLSDDIRRLA